MIIFGLGLDLIVLASAL